jgi:OPA family glycerol-3-phosphate transporter-like MFS transporter
MVAAAETRPDRVGSRARANTLFVLWTTYGSFYFCRVNVGPAVPDIKKALGLSALEIGLVLGAVKLGYATGQLVNGQLTERFGARRILTAGMVGSALVTFLIAFAPALAGAPLLGAVGGAVAGWIATAGGAVGVTSSSSAILGVMLVLAFANGWFQAGGWPPCVKIAGEWFPLRHRGRTMGILGTSYTIGSAIAILCVGWMLTHLAGGWRVAFLVPPLVLLASFAHTALRLKERPPLDLGESVAPESLHPVHRADPAPPPAPPAQRLPIREALAVTLGNGRVWILALGLFGVDAVRYGFLDWAPGHLAETQHTGALPAALKTAVFPLAGALGTLTSGWATDRFFQSRRAPVCAILLAGVAVLTLAYRGVVHVGTTPTVIVLGLVGFCLYGAQILLVGTAAQDFARRGATAAAAGFVDFMGHVGAFSGDVVTGWALRTYGWGGAILWWAFAGMTAAAFVATLWRVRPPDGRVAHAT